MSDVAAAAERPLISQPTAGVVIHIYGGKERPGRAVVVVGETELLAQQIPLAGPGQRKSFAEGIQAGLRTIGLEAVIQYHDEPRRELQIVP